MKYMYKVHTVLSCSCVICIAERASRTSAKSRPAASTHAYDVKHVSKAQSDISYTNLRNTTLTVTAKYES